MKPLCSISFSALLLMLSSCGGSPRATDPVNSDSTIIDSTDMNVKISPEVVAEIRKPLDLYVNAAVEGDSKVAQPAFVEGATITHVEGDSIVCLPIKELFDYYDATGKQPASYEILELNVYGDIAMVSIASVFGDARFNDIFTLARSAEGWKIVSKIFTPA